MVTARLQNLLKKLISLENNLVDLPNNCASDYTDKELIEWKKKNKKS